MIKIYNKNGVILNTQDKYCNENIKVAIDTTDLTPENIVKGKRILGIDGTAEVGSGGGITPSGEITLTTEGTFDVTEYASAKVEVAKEEQTITPTKDTINVYPSDGKFLNKVVVNPIPSNYISPTGETSATANGRYDCTEYAWFNVNVPETIPEGYIKPEGSVEITSNGNHDVTTYATATVNVPIPDGYIVPTGTISVTQNGTVNVTSYASAEINVPIPDGYILPSGNFEITANGDYDITDKKTVSVNVPTGGGGTGPSFDDYLDGNITSYSSTTRTSIGDRAFENSKIYPIDIPNLQVAGNSSFAGVPFTQLNFPNLTSASDHCFANNTSLVSIDLPALTTVGSGCFSGCTWVEFINLPMLEEIPDSVFLNWHKINRMYLPSATSFGGQSFSYNEKLKTVIGGNLRQITGRATFGGCFDLRRLVLGCTEGVNICDLEDTSLFERCAHFLGQSITGWDHELGSDVQFNPQGLKDGIIYAHLNFIEEYKAGTNWSQFAECFKGLVFDTYNEMENIDPSNASTYPNAYIKDEDKFYRYDSETSSWMEEVEE